MGKQKEKKFSLAKFIFIIILICLCIYGYGTYIEPKHLKVKEHKIQSDKISDNFDGFKIVGISDIHYGKYFNYDDLKKLVNKINDLNPDIVVFTGDLIDGKTKVTTNMVNDISKELKKISTTSGKYIISGENDVKFDEWENIITSSEFINLNNNYDTIYKNGYDSILIAYDWHHYKTKQDERLHGFEHPNKALKNAHKYFSGHYSLKNSELYVSNGIGVSNINFRLLSSPTIDVYRLIKTK